MLFAYDCDNRRPVFKLSLDMLRSSCKLLPAKDKLVLLEGLSCSKIGHIVLQLPCPDLTLLNNYFCRHSKLHIIMSMIFKLYHLECDC